MEHLVNFETFINEQALPPNFKSLSRKVNPDAIEILVRVPISKNIVDLKNAAKGNWNLTKAEKKQVEDNLKKRIPVVVTPVHDGETKLSFEVESMKEVTDPFDNVSGVELPQDVGRAQFKLGKMILTRKRNFDSGTLKRLYGNAYEFVRGVEL